MVYNEISERLTQLLSCRHKAFKFSASGHNLMVHGLEPKQNIQNAPVCQSVKWMIGLIVGFKLKYKRIYSRLRKQEHFNGK